MTQRRIDNEPRTMLAIARRLGCALLLLAPTGLGAPRAEEPYPVRPIRLIVGFGAGGPTDIPARFMAEKLGEMLGQRVIVENKPAAAGMIATRDVLSQPRDGYTLLLCTHFEPINTALFRKAQFKLSDIAPVSLIAKYYYGLALANSVPAAAFGDFLRYAQTYPGEFPSVAARRLCRSSSPGACSSMSRRRWRSYRNTKQGSSKSLQ